MPVTVSVYVPAGVPGLLDPPPPPPPPPPPQAASAKASTKTAPSGNHAGVWCLAPRRLRRTAAHANAASSRASIHSAPSRGERGGTGGSCGAPGGLSDAAVVVTVTVTLVGVLPAVTGLGDTVQVASEGAPEQVKLTAPDNPPSPPTLRV